ncbi:hypothetical protein PCE1_000036 [Barthelona sp. PCE]
MSFTDSDSDSDLGDLRRGPGLLNDEADGFNTRNIAPPNPDRELIPLPEETGPRFLTDEYGADPEGEVVVTDDEDGEHEVDLFDTIWRDREAMETAEDGYLDEIVDDNQYEIQSRAQIRAAEQELERRDRFEDTSRALYEDLSDEEEIERQTDLRRLGLRQAATMDEVEVEGLFNLGSLEVDNIKDQLMELRVANAIELHFKQFLRSYTIVNEDGSEDSYQLRAMEAMDRNDHSFVVDFSHIDEELDETMSEREREDSSQRRLIADLIRLKPTAMINILNRAATNYFQELNPEYDSIRDRVYIRFSNYPFVTSIRELRVEATGKLVTVSGIVSHRTPAKPAPLQPAYKCLNCGTVTVQPPVKLKSNLFEPSRHKPPICGECQHEHFHFLDSSTVYTNQQSILLQEPPSSVPPGRLPRSITVYLSHDLCDSCKPGDLITVTAIYDQEQTQSMNLRKTEHFNLFKTRLMCNYIFNHQSTLVEGGFKQEEIDKFNTLARNPNIQQMIIDSIAPTIFGHDLAKMSLAAALFGGVRTVLDSHVVRGDINILMVGDPGVAKSQLLKSCMSLVNRAVFTTGRGASGVGLTAAVRRDPDTHEYTLEGGAMVMADSGICCIDELDKMSDQDRVSIHEALASQTISISKAGIIAQLRAQCSVLAAANPKMGRYNEGRSLMENVLLSDPIVSRFDVIIIMLDKPDEQHDLNMADFVIANHMKLHPNADTLDVNQKAFISDVQSRNRREVIDTATLKRYIAYAKSTFKPHISDSDIRRIANYYGRLRFESARIEGSTKVLLRSVDAIRRLSQAFARMRLSRTVTEKDVDWALYITTEAFINQQRSAAKRELRSRFSIELNPNSDQRDLLVVEIRRQCNEIMVHEGQRLFNIGYRGADLREEIEKNAFTVIANIRERAAQYLGLGDDPSNEVFESAMIDFFQSDFFVHSELELDENSTQSGFSAHRIRMTGEHVDRSIDNLINMLTMTDEAQYPRHREVIQDRETELADEMDRRLDESEGEDVYLSEEEIEDQMEPYISEEEQEEIGFGMVPQENFSQEESDMESVDHTDQPNIIDYSDSSETEV